MQDNDVNSAQQKTNKLKRFIFLIFLPCIIVLTTTGYFYSLGRFVKTENAYIKAPIVSVQSQLAGRVEFVYVKDNQKVIKGQKLLKIENKFFSVVSLCCGVFPHTIHCIFSNWSYHLAG